MASTRKKTCREKGGSRQAPQAPLRQKWGAPGSVLHIRERGCPSQSAGAGHTLVPVGTPKPSSGPVPPAPNCWAGASTSLLEPQTQRAQRRQQRIPGPGWPTWPEASWRGEPAPQGSNQAVGMQVPESCSCLFPGVSGSVGGHIHVPVPGWFLVIAAHHAAVSMVLALSPGAPGWPPPFCGVSPSSGPMPPRPSALTAFLPGYGYERPSPATPRVLPSCAPCEVSASPNPRGPAAQ